jgi:hypothetical protein
VDLVIFHSREINPVSIREMLKLVRFEITLCNDLLQVYKKRVPGKRRKTGVRRIAATGRAQWKDLPECLTGRTKKINEAKSFISKRAYAVTAGKRCRVKKYSASAKLWHSVTPVHN